MDILSHTLTGIAVGTVGCAFVKRGRNSVRKKALIILSGALAGAIPDMDAISLWSGFDDYIGSTFNLSHTGRQIYFGKLWYSHHGMFHSLFMGALIPVLWLVLGSVIGKRSGSIQNRFQRRFHSGKLGMLIFFSAYALHCFEDMITPSGSWDGVRLFFPSTEYYGGWSKIWWWNNYDLFLIILSVIVVNLVFQLFKTKTKSLVFVSFFVGLALFVIQIARRPNMDTIWNKNEVASKNLQKKFLGTKVYNVMEDFDNSMSLHF